MSNASITYTRKESACEVKVGLETLTWACEDGLVNAVKLPSRQWVIAVTV